MGDSIQFSKDNVLKEVMLRLGAPILCVELTADHLEMIYNATCRWWIDATGGQPKLLFKQYSQGEREITLDADIEDVVDVYFTAQYPYQLYFPELFESAVPWPGLYPTFGPSQDVFSSDNMPYSGLVQVLQSLEQAGRILSADRDWDFDPITKLLRIYPQITQAGTIGVKCLTSDLRLECMSKAEQRFFVEWAFAEALELLGTIRTKFDAFPVPGGERSLNGDALLQRGQDLKEKLKEEAFERLKPFLWISG